MKYEASFRAKTWYLHASVNKLITTLLAIVLIVIQLCDRETTSLKIPGDWIAGHWFCEKNTLIETLSGRFSVPATAVEYGHFEQKGRR